MHLFNDVIYSLSPSLPEQRAKELEHVLDNNGATQAQSIDDPTLTHFITNTNRFERWQEVVVREDRGEISVVTDKWVDRSMILGKLQAPSYYSADPAMIFSGVVACATELPAADLEVLSAGISALGGQWRTGLTKDVTHLFAISPTSPKYSTALHFQEHTQVKVLLPHWFDDAVRLGMGNLETDPYEWPDPALLKGPSLREDEDKQKEDALKKTALRKLDPEKKSLYRTASLWSPDAPLSLSNPDISSSTSLVATVTKNVWHGRRILLSRTLQVENGRREAVEMGIKRAGGVVVIVDEDKEADKVDECDVFVTRYRSGKAYVKAVRQAKTIGTLPWMFHVQSTGVLSPPMDQLLWYPIPRRDIEGFSGHEITVTNYTGESREYLKKLIMVMGATFTPSMSGKNTVLIAAYISGTKTTKAASWSIPVVNHTWLEDCFVKWRNLTVALEKYIVFPPGVDFSTMLGERGVGRAVEEIGEEELELLENEEEAGAEVAGGMHRKDAPLGTQNSALDAKEVQDTVGEGLDADGDMQMNDESMHALANTNKQEEDYTMDLDTEIMPERGDREEEYQSPSKSTKALASRLRHNAENKTNSPAKTRVKPKKAVAVEVSPREKAADAPPDRTPTPDMRITKRRSGRIEATPLKKRTRNMSPAQSEESTTSDEAEVVAIASTAKRRAKLVRRAGEKENSWVEEDPEMPMKNDRAKNATDSDENHREVKANTAITGKTKATPRKSSGKLMYSDDENAEESPMAVVRVNKKTPKKIPNKRVDSDNESDIEELVTRGTNKRKSRNVTNKKVDDTENDEKVEDSTMKKSKKAIHRTARISDGDEEPIKSKDRKAAPIPKTKPHSKSKTATRIVSDGEETSSNEPEAAIISPPKTKAKTKTTQDKGPKAKPVPKAKKAIKTDTEAESEDITSSPSPRKRKALAKAQKQVIKANLPGSDEDATPPPWPTKKPQSNLKPKLPQGNPTPSMSSPTRPLKRVVSVLLPQLSLITKKTPQKARENNVHTPQLTRAESIRVTANERAAPRPSASRPPLSATASGSKAKVKAALPLDKTSSPAPTTEEDTSAIISGRLKRSAATRATQKLHDEVMPDVMNYQLEMRNGGRIRRSLGGSAGPGSAMRKKRLSDTQRKEESETDEVQERNPKRQRVFTPEPPTANESEEDVQPMKVLKGRPKNKTAAGAEGDDSPTVPKQTETKAKKGNKVDGLDTSPTVKLMTTQVTLPDDVIKSLIKLGVKTTTRPAECTHLLAPHLVRTEKFLCALAVAPYILTEKWAIDSAATKKLLDERDYLLHDKANERKYEFVLADALTRAKELRGGLFSKMTFYVTPRVPIDMKLLKNVVTACGGQFNTQTPTLRILNANPNRYVISCAEDVSIWRPLARAHPMYTHELILTAALKQKVDWDNETFRVAGSES